MARVSGNSVHIKTETYLDTGALVQRVLLHVDRLAREPIDTPRATTAGMLGPQLGDDTQNVTTAVLDERARDRLKCVRNTAVLATRPTDTTQLCGDRQLSRATTGSEKRVEHGVTCDGHRVLQVTVDLVEDVLARPTEQDCARLGRNTLVKEREVLVTELLDVEQPAPCADIGLSEVVDAVDNDSADSTCDAVVVALADTAQCGDASLEKMVLRKVADALLGEDEIRLDGDDRLAHAGDLLLLDVECAFPICLTAEFHVGLGLAFLVLEWAVEKNDTWLLDPAAHLGMRDVLVEHDTAENARLLDRATRDLSCALAAHSPQTKT